MVLRRRLLVMLAAILTVIGAAGCATGDDAAVYGGSFTFTSPGGRTDFAYSPNERGTVGALGGPDLAVDRTILVSDYTDKVVVLNFWGPRCPPCRSEQDALSLMSRELADRDVQFLGIDVQDSKSDGQDFYRDKDVPYPSIYDPSMRTLLSLRGYPASAIPSAVVLDRQHRVAQVWLVSAAVPLGEMKSRIAEIAGEVSATTSR